MYKKELTHAENKILILYLLNELDIKLKDDQIIRILCENEWMSYFDYKRCMIALTENHMIDENQFINGLFYNINDIGKSTLEYFTKELPFSLRTKIKDYCKENKDDLECEARIFAEYYAIGDDEYKVIMKIMENNITIFEIDLLAYSQASAQKYIDAWKKRANELFKTCHEMLL